MQSSIRPAAQYQGITPRQAAVVAGVCLLIMAVAAPFAEFYARRTLVIPGEIARTLENLVDHRGLALAGIFAYLVTFILDVIVAWALYVLLLPVNRSLALLAAWFRLVYSAIAFAALFKLVTVFRIASTPEYLTAVGPEQLHAQAHLLLSSWRYEWSLGMLLFAIHLGLLGWLVYRSGYIPWILGVLLSIAGLGYLLSYLRPYLYPDARLGFLTITFFGELVFMLWLLGRGGKIPDAADAPTLPEHA